MTQSPTFTPVTKPSLTWVSSDESIVKVAEAGNLSATVQAVAGGTVTISAFNKSTVATVSSDEVHSTGAYGLEAFKINCNVPAKREFII